MEKIIESDNDVINTESILTLKVILLKFFKNNIIFYTFLSVK